ncbi:MAG TPA: redoxin domain-containing protein [Chitinophagaceae bacterium]|nr:redoxin domain-containing protein [Chitinophagaceae bacterium]
MKTTFYAICFVLFSAVTVFANEGKPVDTIPPFKIMQTDGRFFQASDLAKNKPVVLIYFAPDCQHCQVLMQGLFKNLEAFKKVQLVLITFKPLNELALFERQYRTAGFSNIRTGTEGSTYFLRYYYNLSNTPFTAVYNKQGTLVRSFRDINTPISEIQACVKNLN